MKTQKKIDRRTNRTRRSLSHALVELVKEKRFDDITVQEVIDRANVGRSTFYTHFRDKEDLFQKDWEGFLDRLAELIDWTKAGSCSFVPIVFLFEHLQVAQPFYKGLVRSRKAEAVFSTGTQYLSERLEASLAGYVKYEPAIPTAILANYLASQLFVLLKWWLDDGMPYSPQRMDDIFHRLVNPTFLAALKPSPANSTR